MLNNLTEMPKGVLEGCVVEISSSKETYGYEITQQLNDLFFTDIVEGTVYTILVRLEKNKLVSMKKNIGYRPAAEMSEPAILILHLEY